MGKPIIAKFTMADPLIDLNSEIYQVPQKASS
jgi:hypothetical protein